MLAGGVTVARRPAVPVSTSSRAFFPIGQHRHRLAGRSRSVILRSKAAASTGRCGRWTSIAAATDFLLALVLLVGLSLSSVVVLLFGPTPAIVASFAWVLALSFVATGLLLLEVASCEREAGET